jgi:hypothetical protein
MLIHYGFESGALTTDNKSGLTLTNNNGVTSVAGKVGNSASFNQASSQYLSLADNATVSLGGTSAWWSYFARLDAKDESGKTFVCKDNTGSVREYFQMWNAGADRFIFDTWTATGDVGNKRLTLDTFGAPSIGVWYWLQFGITYGSGADAIMWGSVNDGPVDQIAAPNAGWNGAESLLLGSLNTIPGYYHHGLMDQFLFSKTIPSASDRTWLYNSGNGRAWADIVTGPSAPPSFNPAWTRGSNVVIL